MTRAPEQSSQRRIAKPVLRLSPENEVARLCSCDKETGMTSIRRLLVVCATVTAALSAPLTSAAATAEYAVVRTVPLGAPDRWDYVVFDSDSGRVFVAHGDELAVVDGQSGEVVGRVKGLSGGTHGIALVKESNRGYTDEGETGKAVSFDLKSLGLEKRTPAAEDADAIAFDPASNHVFVINGDTGTITVIDP